MPPDSLKYFEHKPNASAITVIGVPLDLGKDSVGTDTGADYLRASGLTAMLKKIGVPFEDAGNIPCPGRGERPRGDKKVKFLEPICETLTTVAETVRQKIAAGRTVIALGGDHTISIGTISGASAAVDGDLGLIYIDAHPDANTDESSLSGNIHGMVTTALMGLGHKKLTAVGGDQVKIKPENLILVGAKDFDQAEIDIIRREKVSVFTPVDFEAAGFGALYQKIKELSKRVKKVWVSFDIDSIDSQFAPATPMSTAGGLTYREINSLSRFIGKECDIAGLDIVECMPIGDVANKSAFTAITFVAQVLGAEYSWYTAYMEEEEKKQSQR